MLKDIFDFVKAQINKNKSETCIPGTIQVDYLNITFSKRPVVVELIEYLISYEYELIFIDHLLNAWYSIPPRIFLSLYLTPYK